MVVVIAMIVHERETGDRERGGNDHDDS